MTQDLDPNSFAPAVSAGSVELSLTAPVHGWIRVTLRIDDFQLSCAASTVLNDPLEEFADFALFVRGGFSGFRRVCLWLEPEGYALDVQFMDRPSVMVTVWEDDSFVPPMAGREMTRKHRCILPRHLLADGVITALSGLLDAPASPGDGLDALRSKDAQLNASPLATSD